MNLNKNLAKLFSVPANPVESKPSQSGGTFDSANLQKDYEMVQSNLKNLIGTGNEALEAALRVATESDSPRAFEVVAIMLKTMAELNNNVIDIHKKVKDTTGNKLEVKQTNNSVFVGSTKDLQNLLNKERSTDKDLIEAEVVNNEQKQQPRLPEQPQS